jgi:hypothetical protein
MPSTTEPALSTTPCVRCGNLLYEARLAKLNAARAFKPTIALHCKDCAQALGTPSRVAPTAVPCMDCGKPLTNGRLTAVLERGDEMRCGPCDDAARHRASLYVKGLRFEMRQERWRVARVVIDRARDVVTARRSRNAERLIDAADALARWVHALEEFDRTHPHPEDIT